jgi:hypothetical protein
VRYSDIQASRQPGDPEPRARKTTKDEWEEKAWYELLRLACIKEEFTSDDLAAVVPAPTESNTPGGEKNRIGSLFTQAKNRGLIEWTGRVVQSRQVSRKGSLNRIWVGTPAGAREWERLGGTK